MGKYIPNAPACLYRKRLDTRIAVEHRDHRARRYLTALQESRDRLRVCRHLEGIPHQDIVEGRLRRIERVE